MTHLVSLHPLVHILCSPMFALGFAVQLDPPQLELAFGPFTIVLGQIDFDEEEDL